MIRTAAFATLALVAAATPATAAVFAAIEAPGKQFSTVNFTYGGTEEFDGLSGRQTSYDTTFSGSDIRATITGFDVRPADQFGGAFGTGSYALAGNPTTIRFTGGPAVNYFGLWASALDGANSIAFFSQGVQIASFNLVATLNGVANPAAYRGNPAAAFRGQNGGESYAFINFLSDTSFDRIDLTQNGGGGFELDNLTVGFATANAVPEPATWGTMLLGFGLVGSVARRRRSRRMLPAAC